MKIKKLLEITFNIAEKYIDSDISNPIINPLPPELNREHFSLQIDNEGMSEQEFSQALERVVMNTPKTASKKFFNQLFGGRNAPALAAEILTTVTNNSMYTYKIGGVQIAIEKEVIETKLDYVGFKDGDGGFMPGGSLSNMVAMMIARNEKEESLSANGFSGKKLIAYTSDQAHYSIEKNGAILGIGGNNVRKVISDKKGKMNVLALEEAIKQDLKEGNIPFFVNATAGTTVLGAFDPFIEITKITQKYHLWLHVDAAWGGGVFLSKRYNYLIQGVANAHSVTWNAHKMMGVPLSASAILLKQKGLLYKHFSMKSDYLYQIGEDEWNPGLSSLQCGRRNDAFKVWAAWKYYGKHGYEERTEKQFALAKYATQIIKNSPEFSLILEPEGLNVCFTVEGVSAIELCNNLYEKGLLQVGYGSWQEKSFIRLILVNPDMEFSDIDEFFHLIRTYLHKKL
jgi:sulfinoalanine decarboxylase/sulfinoalanine decarboxylase/aspartate 1-decarboxylase